MRFSDGAMCDYKLVVLNEDIHRKTYTDYV